MSETKTPDTPPATAQIFVRPERVYRPSGEVAAELVKAREIYRDLIPKVEAYQKNRREQLDALQLEENRWKKLYPTRPFDPSRLAFPITVPPQEWDGSIRYHQIHCVIGKLENELEESKKQESRPM